MNLLTTVYKSLLLGAMFIFITGISSNVYATCYLCSFDLETGNPYCTPLLCISQDGHTGCSTAPPNICHESGNTCSGPAQCKLFSDEEQFIKTAKYSPWLESSEEQFTKTAKYSSWSELNNNSLYTYTTELNNATPFNYTPMSNLVEQIAYKTKANSPTLQDNQENKVLGILQMDAQTVLKMAEVHPRLAMIATEHLSNRGYFYPYSRYKITPVPLTVADIKNLVDPNKESNAAYRAYEQRAREANKDALKTGKTFFEVVATTEILPKYPDQATIRFIVSSEIRQDPPYMTMVWRIKKDPQSGIWNLSEWQIK